MVGWMDGWIVSQSVNGVVVLFGYLWEGNHFADDRKVIKGARQNIEWHRKRRER